MAVFNNPISPTSDPSYLKASQPIHAFEGDRSSEFALKGAGQLLETGVKVADYFVKENIDKEIYDAVDSERDAATGAAEVAHNITTGVNLNLDLGTQPDNLPLNVRTGLRQVESLTAAAEARKIPQTYYQGRLTAIAKNLRSEYLGYREYIDNKIASITGGNPANRYLELMLSDIQATQRASKGDSARTLTLFKENMDVSGAHKMFQLYANNQVDDNQVFMFFTPRLAEKAAAETKARERTASNNDDTDKQRDLERDVSSWSANFSKDHFQNQRIELGIEMEGGKFLTPSEIVERIDRAQAVGGMNPEAARQLSYLTQVSKANYEKQFMERVNDPKFGYDGRAPIDILGPEKINKVRNEGAAMFDRITERVHNKEFGIAAVESNMVKDRLEAAQAGLLRDPSIGPYLAKTAAFEKIAPEYAKQFFVAGLPEMSGKMRAYILDSKMDVYNQPDLRRTGEVKTLNGFLEDAKAKGVANKIVNSSVMDTVSVISSPNASDVLKANVVYAAFHPDNRGILAKFQSDYIDPSTGQNVPGRQSVFRKMTTPEITAEIKRLSKSNKQLWDMYQGWVTDTFQNDVFREDLRNLSHIQLMPDAGMTFDPEQSRFGIRYKDQTDVNLGPVGQFFNEQARHFREGVRRTLTFQGWAADLITEANASRIVNRINESVASLKQVAVDGGFDPNLFIFKTMMQAGFDPTKGTPVSMPDHMVKVVAKLIGQNALKEGLKNANQKEKKD